MSEQQIPIKTCPMDGNKRGDTYFSKQDLYEEVLRRYPILDNIKNIQSYSKLTRPQLCNFLGIDVDSTDPQSIRHGEHDKKKLSTLDKRLVDYDNKQTVSQDSEEITETENSEVAPSLQGSNETEEKRKVRAERDAKRKAYNTKALLERTERKKKEKLEEEKEEADFANEEMDEENRIRNTKKVRASLMCRFIDNYSEVDLLKFNELLLDIFSGCVRDHIDQQNALISEEYLKQYRYKGEGKDDSGKPLAYQEQIRDGKAMAERGICDVSASETEAETKVREGLINDIKRLINEPNENKNIIICKIFKHYNEIKNIKEVQTKFADKGLKTKSEDEVRIYLNDALENDAIKTLVLARINNTKQDGTTRGEKETLSYILLETLSLSLSLSWLEESSVAEREKNKQELVKTLTSTKELMNSKIRELRKLPNISMYHNIVYSLLLKNNETVLPPDGPVGGLDLQLSGKYTAELMEIYYYIKNQTQSFRDIEKVIYYLNIFNQELKSFIKEGVSSVKNLLGVIPVLANQFYNLISKSKMLKMNPGMTLSDLKKILDYYGLIGIVTGMEDTILHNFLKMDSVVSITRNIEDFYDVADDLIEEANLNIFKKVKIVKKQIQSLYDRKYFEATQLYNSAQKFVTDKTGPSITVVTELYTSAKLIRDKQRELTLAEEQYNKNKSDTELEEKYKNALQNYTSAKETYSSKKHIFEYSKITSYTDINDKLSSLASEIKTLYYSSKKIDLKKIIVVNDLAGIITDSFDKLAPIISDMPGLNKMKETIYKLKTTLVDLKENPYKLSTLSKEAYTLAKASLKDFSVTDKVQKAKDFVKSTYDSIGIKTENIINSLSEENLFILTANIVDELEQLRLKAQSNYDASPLAGIIKPVLEHMTVAGALKFFIPEKSEGSMTTNLVKFFENIESNLTPKEKRRFNLVKRSAVPVLLLLYSVIEPVNCALSSNTTKKVCGESLGTFGLLGLPFVYMNAVLTSCYKINEDGTEQQEGDFKMCVVNKSKYILTKLIESGFVILRNFIDQNFKKGETIYTGVAVIDNIKQEERKKYAIMIVETIFSLFNHTDNTEVKEEKTDDFGTEGTLLWCKNKVNNLVSFVVTITPDLKEHREYINFFVDLTFVILSNLSDQGIFLFKNQFLFAYMNNLSNPKSDIYNAIVLSDLPKLIFACIKIAINSFPTLLLKYFQIFDSIMKDTPYAELWMKVVGKKLDYPIMGPQEVDIISTLVLHKSSYKDSQQRELKKVEKLLFPASVGQVHLFKSKEELKLTHTSFEETFLDEFKYFDKNSDEYKINKYMYLIAKNKEFVKLLKAEKSDLQTMLNKFNHTVLDSMNFNIFMKLNWSDFVKSKSTTTVKAVFILLMFYLIKDKKDDLYGKNELKGDLAKLMDIKLNVTGNPTYKKEFIESIVNLLKNEDVKAELKTSIRTYIVDDTKNNNKGEMVESKEEKEMVSGIMKSFNEIVYKSAASSLTEEQKQTNLQLLYKVFSILPSKFDIDRELSVLEQKKIEFSHEIKKEDPVEVLIKSYYKDAHKYKTYVGRQTKITELLKIISIHFTILNDYGVEGFYKFMVDKLTLDILQIETDISKQIVKYNELYKGVLELYNENETILNGLQASKSGHIYKVYKDHIDAAQSNVDAVVKKLKLQKYIIKFVKIRSRMGLCIEKSILPESVQKVVTVYEKKKFDEDLLKIFKSFVGILTCKIKDVSDEFDLWQELVNTNQAKELYDYPKAFSGDYDYDELDNYRIRVADIMKSFEQKPSGAVKDSDGIAPLYLVEKSEGDSHSESDDEEEKDEEIYVGQEIEGENEDENIITPGDTKNKVPGYNFTLFNDPITGESLKKKKKIGIQRGFYTAMIQDQMTGNTVGKLEKDKMSPKELECMKKAVLKFISIFLVTIMSEGKYHGDPHPGNLMWDYKEENGINIGQLSVIDFGDWVEIKEDRRMALFSLAIFILITFFNPLPKTYTDQYICIKLSNFIVKLLRLDSYSVTKLAKFYINNKLYKTEVNEKELIEKMKNNTEYKSAILTVCSSVLEIRIKNRLLELSKKITKKINGGTIGNAFMLLKDSELFNKLFVEINNINKVKNESGDEKIDCEKFGQSIYKLVESILKLYEFKNYLTFETGEIVDLAFSMMCTLVENKNIIKSHADSLTYIEIIKSMKIVAFLLLNIDRPEYKNNEDYVTKLINLYITGLAGAVTATGLSFAASSFSNSLFLNKIAGAVNNSPTDLNKLVTGLNNLDSKKFQEILNMASTTDKGWMESAADYSSSGIVNTLGSAGFVGTATTLISGSPIYGIVGYLMSGLVKSAGTAVVGALGSTVFLLLAVPVICIYIWRARSNLKSHVQNMGKEERQSKKDNLRIAIAVKNGQTIEIILDTLIEYMYEAVSIFGKTISEKSLNSNVLTKTSESLKATGSIMNGMFTKLGGHNLQNNVLSDMVGRGISYSTRNNKSAIKTLKYIGSIIINSISSAYEFTFSVPESYYNEAGLMSYFDKEKMKNLYTNIPTNSTFLYYIYYSTLKSLDIMDTSIPAPIKGGKSIILYINHQNILKLGQDIASILSSDTDIKTFDDIVNKIMDHTFKDGGFVHTITENNNTLTTFTEKIKTNKSEMLDQEQEINEFINEFNISDLHNLKDTTKLDKFVENISSYKRLLIGINTAKISYMKKVVEYSNNTYPDFIVIPNITVKYDPRPYKGFLGKMITDMNSNVPIDEVTENYTNFMKTYHQYVEKINMYTKHIYDKLTTTRNTITKNKKMIEQLESTKSKLQTEYDRKKGYFKNNEEAEALLQVINVHIANINESTESNKKLQTEYDANSAVYYTLKSAEDYTFVEILINNIITNKSISENNIKNLNKICTMFVVKISLYCETADHTKLIQKAKYNINKLLPVFDEQQIETLLRELVDFIEKEKVYNGHRSIAEEPEPVQKVANLKFPTSGDEDEEDFEERLQNWRTAQSTRNAAIQEMSKNSNALLYRKNIMSCKSKDDMLLTCAYDLLFM